jgi:hypothetical protein
MWRNSAHLSRIGEQHTGGRRYNSRSGACFGGPIIDRFRKLNVMDTTQEAEERGGGGGEQERWRGREQSQCPPWSLPSFPFRAPPLHAVFFPLNSPPTCTSWRSWALFLARRLLPFMFRLFFSSRPARLLFPRSYPVLIVTSCVD